MGIPPREVTPFYLNNILFLFIGGFIIALAMERWNLHRRIALKVILSIGGSPNRLLLAASIGGMATLEGTAPNLSLARIYSISFPDAREITFLYWISV